jgi:hypothetical protein
MFKSTLHAALLAGAVFYSANAMAAELRTYGYPNDRVIVQDTISSDGRHIIEERRVITRDTAALPANFTTITGEVVAIRGMGFQAMTPNGIMDVNMATMDYNPTGPDYAPRLERGDTVTISGLLNSDSTLNATEVVAIQKPWQNYVTYGQAYVGEDVTQIAPAAGDSTTFVKQYRAPTQ